MTEKNKFTSYVDPFVIYLNTGVIQGLTSRDQIERLQKELEKQSDRIFSLGWKESASMSARTLKIKPSAIIALDARDVL